MLATDGARCSIDSTNILEFRPSDLDSSSLTEHEIESPKTTESFFTAAMTAGYGTAATAVTTAAGVTEIVVTPVALQQHQQHHHPHMFHHHRQYRQQQQQQQHIHHHHHFVSPSVTQASQQQQQRVIPRVTVVEAGRATSTGDIDIWVDEQEPQHTHPSVRRVTSSPVPKSFMKDIP